MIDPRDGARALLCLLVLPSCDPVWHVRNPATTTARVEPGCIEAGLRVLAPEVRRNAATDNSYVELYAKTEATSPQSIMVRWEVATPTELILEVRAVGSQADPKVVEGYRAARADVVAHIEKACGATVTLGPEDCARCK